MSDDVTVKEVLDVYEEFHIVGGSGSVSRGGALIKTFQTIDELRHIVRNESRQATERRVMAAAMAVSVLSHFHCSCDECCELRDAAASFRSLGACYG